MDKETLQELKSKAENYQHQVELKVLDNCPFIVEVGLLTVTTNENGQVITHNSNYPTQFTQKAVNEILQMNFKNGNGEKVIPKVYGRKEWYQKRLDEVQQTLNLFQSN